MNCRCKLTIHQIMKKIIVFFVAFLAFTSAFSQIRIEGGISVNIDLPIPDIVISTRKPRPAAPSRRPANVHVCNHNCNHSFGQIHNQNTSRGSYIYEVVDARLVPENDIEERLILNLDNGETLEIIIITARTNDVNYSIHNHNNCHCSEINQITAVLLNNQTIASVNGSLSLQPLNNGLYQAVINIHSLYDGDFNGSITF